MTVSNVTIYSTIQSVVLTVDVIHFFIEQKIRAQNCRIAAKYIISWTFRRKSPTAKFFVRYGYG